MTKEQAKKNAEVMMAFAEGRKIEILCDDGQWAEIEEPDFDFIDFKYRIKKEPSYRPFINTIECFNEMKKHEPFGWLYEISSHNYILVSEIGTEGVYAPNGLYNFNKAKCELYFTDGTPFGMKV